MKRFDDADAYESDIARVLPGHALLRQTAICELVRQSTDGHTLGVVGPGPGLELPALAAALPGVTIDAVEPSSEMADACERRVRDEGLQSRVRVTRSVLLPAKAPTWDMGLSLLVAHLVDARGSARREYWRAIASHLRPGATLMHAEIASMALEEVDAWVAYGASQGCDSKRVTVLRERLTTGFSLLSWQDSVRLAAEEGLRLDQDVLRVWGLRLGRFEAMY